MANNTSLLYNTSLNFYHAVSSTHKHYLQAAAIFSLSFLAQSIFAAQSIDLYFHPTLAAPVAIKLSTATSMPTGEDQIIRKSVDKNGTTHIHMQQMYKGQAGKF